jgi:hypothetical protein
MKNTHKKLIMALLARLIRKPILSLLKHQPYDYFHLETAA